MRKPNHYGWCFSADCNDAIGLDLDDVIEGSDVIPVSEPAYRESVVVALPALTESERADLLLAHRLESRMFPLPKIVRGTEALGAPVPKPIRERPRIRRIQRARARPAPTPAVQWDTPLTSEQAEVVDRIRARTSEVAP